MAKKLQQNYKVSHLKFIENNLLSNLSAPFLLTLHHLCVFPGSTHAPCVHAALCLAKASTVYTGYSLEPVHTPNLSAPTQTHPFSVPHP